MQPITNRIELINAINLLEVDHENNQELLKEQFLISFESLKPFSIIKSTLKEVYSSPLLGESILGTTIGLATGYLSKKIVVGLSGSILSKLFGTILQVGVTKVVSKHPDTIISLGQYIFQHVFRKKELNSQNRVN